MALSTQYVIAPSLEMLFRDKVSGDPLSGGTVEFFKDAQRTVKKDIFKLSGTQPNYTYVALPNPSTLSSVGTFLDDSGNNIVPYFNPFDAEGNIELYYIVVKDSGGTEQFTREAWPNEVTDVADADRDVENFIPNGQFLLHTDLPATSTLGAGEIRADSTNVAPGGWYYVRSAGSLAKDFVKFNNNGSYVIVPTASPRYVVELECTQTHAGDTFKDFRIRFQDINKFSTSTSQQFTFSFTGKSTSGGNETIQTYLIKNFGTGGSTETQVAQGPAITLDSNSTIVNVPFTFGDNIGKTIGTQDDDYVEVALRIPPQSLFKLELDNFVLTLGDVEVEIFPNKTDGNFIRDSLFSNIEPPNADGTDLYLPIVFTANGAEYDDSSIGEPYLSLGVDATDNVIAYDGTKYETTTYSSLGIPYSRIYNKKLRNDSINIPRAGTGLDYFTAVYGTALGYTGSIFKLVNNSAGVVTAPANVSAGITVETPPVHIGTASYGFRSYMIGSTTFHAETLVTGAPNAAATAGTTGWTVSNSRPGSTSVHNVDQITVTTAASLAGKYFLISNTTTDFYVWYQVDGVGVDPAVASRTGILVNIISAVDTLSMISQKTRESLNAFDSHLISFPSASTITGGTYWTANATGDDYYIWYEKNGVGTDPLVVGKIGIKVILSGSETSAQVTLETQKAINSKFFAVPDLRGYFARGTGGDSLTNPDSAERWNITPGYSGDNVLSLQLSENLSHNHVSSTVIADPSARQIGAEDTLIISASVTGDNGKQESRPISFAATWVAKY